MVQAATLSLYGGDLYSWRINGMLMVFLSAPAIYLLVRQLKSSNAGLLAAVLFVSAHHLIGFSRPGYYALQIFPGAISMPPEEIETNFGRLDKAKEIVTYCWNAT